MPRPSSLKAALRRSVRLLPSRIKTFLGNALCEDPEFVKSRGRMTVAALADQLGIDGIRSRGEYGDVVSSPHDYAVFATYASTGRWAEHTNELIGRFFDKAGRGTFLDIGANIGLTTIPVARRANVACHAFEPEPENFRNLRQNIRANCAHANVTLYQVALFERETELPFELAEGNLGDHRIHVASASINRRGEHSRKVVMVPAARLDDLVQVDSGALAIKIDTQGAEPFVFAGGPRTVAAADLLVLEWWPYSIDRMGGDPALVLNALRRSFQWGRMARGEGAEDTPLLPMAEICAQLESSFATDKQAHRTYFDVAAVKAKDVAI